MTKRPPLPPVPISRVGTGSSGRRGCQAGRDSGQAVPGHPDVRQEGSTVPAAQRLNHRVLHAGLGCRCRRANPETVSSWLVLAPTLVIM